MSSDAIRGLGADFQLNDEASDRTAGRTPSGRRVGLGGRRAGHLQDLIASFASVAIPVCRFVLSNIKEGELRDENRLAVFEPDVALLVDGKNAFESFGRRKLPVVIMASREVWLRETANLVRGGLDRGTLQWEYHYPLYGTLNDIYVVPSKNDAKIFIDWQQKGHLQVGNAPVREWVRAIAAISRELSDLFRRYQPSLFKDSIFAKNELLLQEIESWLIAHKED